jgi:ElaB/YqjD/DUF883 family membrane-anchored ribosome-binding protein
VAQVDVQPTVEEHPTIRDRVLDGCRQAAHVSHEARLLKSVAQDAIEDGLYAAKRAVKSVRRRAEDIGDLKDEAIHRLKRRPLLAVTSALGVGVALGLVVATIAFSVVGMRNQTPTQRR